VIHAIGDSHADKTFGWVPGVVRHHLGPVTMHRVGREHEPLLQAAVDEAEVTRDDLVIFCFGEIDARCHVHQRMSTPGLLEQLVGNYLDKVRAIRAHGARIGVLCVVPPTTFERSFNRDLPVTGSDEERVGYVQRMNDLLADGCRDRGLFFLDIYREYADERGMLRLDLADESVHVKDTSRVHEVMLRRGLVHW
jgi:hypothetical protein